MPVKKCAKRTKFGNRWTIIDGVKFQSETEAARWLVLRAMEKAGAIADLQLQVRYPLLVNGKKVCTYVSDFTYIRDGQEVTEDVKSAYTAKLPVFILKAKLFAAVHGREIEVYPKLLSIPRRKRVSSKARLPSRVKRAQDR